MRFCGLDLAAEPRNTGLAMLTVHDTELVLDSLQVGVSDDQIIEAIQQAERTGVDVPLGWPSSFVEFVQNHAASRLPAPQTTDASWRRSLALRTTDRHIQAATGLSPLSVSANLIAYPAFRWAGLEARLRQAGVDVSRDGTGRVAEVYPAAALYRWGLPHTGYKGAKHRLTREELIGALSARCDRFEWNGFEDLAVVNDDAFDAVLAALVSYHIAQGWAQGPPPEHLATAKVEGWIWLPAPFKDPR